MPGQRTYLSDFDNERRRAYVRSRSQAWFRNEQWSLTWEEFQDFWSTTDLWQQRGRHNTDLVLTRVDWQGPWSKDNCCIITRLDHLRILCGVRIGKDIDKMMEDAKKYENL